MSHPDFILLYVKNPVESAAFYTALLGRPPVEASPGFALFVLDSGLKLGLWSVQAVAPAASLTGGGAELVFPVPDLAALQARLQAWQALGVPVAQPITAMDFGHTFTALDPDGHRLRVYLPGAPS